MALNPLDRLVRDVEDMKRQLAGRSQLNHSSLENTAIPVYDDEGQERLRIGAQDDGTHSVKYVQGPPPPRPTPPVVSVDGPVVRVRWDGELMGGHTPEDFSRIDVHFALASDDLEDPSAVRGNLATSAGNETVLAATQTGAYRVGLVAMSQSRARSEMSDTVEVEVTLVDIEGTLDSVVENARGGSNYYTPTPPPGTDHDPDRDLWFDTSEDEDGLTRYTPHRWDGQEWVSLGDERVQAIKDAQDALRDDVEQIITDGSGATTYWLPTEPDETAEPTPKTGDIWFDTSDGNKLYRHDGQGWISASDSRFDTIQGAYDDLAAEVATVRTSVDGKNRITQSVDAPPTQYDGAVGDRWERMSSMGSGGSLISNWRWNGDVWVSTIISDAVLGNVDAAKIGTGYLDADRIEAGAITADKVAVGISGNLAVDPLFSDPETSALRVGNSRWEWLTVDGETFFQSVMPDPKSHGNLSIVSQSGELLAYPASVGIRYVVEVEVEGPIWKYLTVLAGSGVTSTPAASIQLDTRTERRTVRFEFDPQDYTGGVGFNGTPVVAFGINLRQAVSASVPVGGITRVYSIRVSPMSGATVIEGGAITTDKIAVGAITSDSGIFGEIDAGILTAGEIAAARIGANTITGDKLLIGGAGNLLPGADDFATSRAGWSAFGHNANHPSVWLKGTQEVRTDAPFALRSGATYKASVDVQASVPGTTFYWQVVNVDNAAITQYVFVQEAPGTSWTSHVAEFTVPTTGNYRLRVFSNHSTGAPNPDGWQWFRAPRIVSMTGATLIENGAITTEKIATGAITGESGILARLDAGVITYGEMSGARLQAGTVDTEQLAFGAATGDIVSADALNFKRGVGLDLVSSSFRAGDAVEITEEYGFRQFGPDGALNVDFPSDGSPASVRGDFSARRLSAQQLQLTGETTVASGADMVIESGVTAPAAAPQVTPYWGRVAMPPLTDRERAVGVAWGEGHWWRLVTTSVPLAEGGRTRIEKISPDGQLVDTVTGAYRTNANGITYLNGELYVLAAALSVSGDGTTPTRPRMVVVYGTDGVERRRWEYAYYGSGTYEPGIGTNGTDIVTGQCLAQSGELRLRRFSPTGALLETLDTGRPIRSDIGGVYIGPADFGTQKLVVAKRFERDTSLKQVTTYDMPGSTYRDDLSWHTPNRESPHALAWDGVNFWTMTGEGNLVRYSRREGSAKVVGDDSPDWWLAASWRDSPAESMVGPAARFAWPHRSELLVTVPDIPKGVTGAAFFVARQDEEPVRTDLHWAAEINHAARTVIIPYLPGNWSGLRPPVGESSFTDREPGEIRSALGNFRVDGAGAGRWGPLEFHADGTMTGPYAHGTVVVTPVANTSTALEVTLPAGRFSSPPTVVATLQTGNLNSAQNVGVNYQRTTKDSFEVVLLRNNTVVTSINWIAIGE